MRAASSSLAVITEGGIHRDSLRCWCPRLGHTHHVGFATSSRRAEERLWETDLQYHLQLLHHICHSSECLSACSLSLPSYPSGLASCSAGCFLTVSSTTGDAQLPREGWMRTVQLHRSTWDPCVCVCASLLCPSLQLLRKGMAEVSFKTSLSGNLSVSFCRHWPWGMCDRLRSETGLNPVSSVMRSMGWWG